jgi:RNA polymerase sigma factor (TIGR02999 family)
VPFFLESGSRVSSDDDMTLMLAAIHQGDAEAHRRLFSLIYDDLRAMAAGQMRPERAEHTLQPTALVHEAYLRLIGNAATNWESRAHFFGAAAEAMRRILVDHARARLAIKRGGGQLREPLDDAPESDWKGAEEILAVDEALAHLEKDDPQRGRIVKLHFYSGLTFDEIASGLGLSVRTVKRQWEYARVWLFRRIRGD